jgi:hypothetical protein
MRQAFEMHDHVRSLRDQSICGPIIGFGTIIWSDKEGEDEKPQLVYLIQTREEGSSGLGPAVAVLQADQTVGRWMPEETNEKA